MIQRIQSVFLLIVVLSQAALHFTGLDVEVFGNKFVIATLSLISFIIALISLFSFKKRKRQIMLNRFNIYINALLMGVLVYWLLNLSGGMMFPEKGIEPIFPLLSIFCLVIANIYIRRDERLVKSVDRLR